MQITKKDTTNPFPPILSVISALKENEAKLIKPYDPENKSRKHAKYIPFWA